MSTRGDQTCLDYIIDHQTDIDYSIYLVVMYLCAIDIYFASFYDFFAPRNEVVREYTGFTMSLKLSYDLG
jgi:hypothetical protein